MTFEKMRAAERKSFGSRLICACACSTAAKWFWMRAHTKGAASFDACLSAA